MPWTPDFHLNHQSTPKRVRLVAANATAANEAISCVLQTARERNLFKCLDGWRDEEYRILGARSEIKVERAGAGILGIITNGVHMTLYTRLKESGDMRIWVPTRSMTTKAYPGMLDSSVAGGVPIGVEPFACLVKEAAEEASLSEDLTRRSAKSVGVVWSRNTWYHYERRSHDAVHAFERIGRYEDLGSYSFDDYEGISGNA